MQSRNVVKMPGGFSDCDQELISHWWSLSHRIRCYKVSDLFDIINEYIKCGTKIIDQLPARFAYEIYRIEYCVLMEAVCDERLPYECCLECLNKTRQRFEDFKASQSPDCYRAGVNHLENELNKLLSFFAAQAA